MLLTHPPCYLPGLGFLQSEFPPWRTGLDLFFLKSDFRSLFQSSQATLNIDSILLRPRPSHKHFIHHINEHTPCSVIYLSIKVSLPTWLLPRENMTYKGISSEFQSTPFLLSLGRMGWRKSLRRGWFIRIPIHDLQHNSQVL